ncbi:siderophore-interacting protein [Aestuariimicrobium kwangyangense]|uniref:siderophore-interacting protein n=1 Tax=Aestuariimicrobium kwangyangense TaxID=396389 RepID=UPI0003B75662|nr:siderophore-interacting protein [Aestuariimicrobium kwangyangense]
MTTPYRTYSTRLAARTRVSSSFVRITLAGDDLGDCSPTLLDQRVKLLFGDEAALDLMLTSGEDWYAALLAAGDQRPALRTYTLVAVRPSSEDPGTSGEVDIDVAVHPVDEHQEAPGMRFALDAPLGARTVLVAGDRTVPGHDTVGVAWRPPVSDEVVLVGDETALPAVLNIVASLPSHTHGRVVLEVPHADDVREVPLPVGVTIEWVVRDRGERMPRVFDRAPATPDEGSSDEGASAERPSDDEPLLWDEAAAGRRPGATRQAWIAGEAGWVRALRAEARAAGVPKDEVSFMGYWRRGVTGS